MKVGFIHDHPFCHIGNLYYSTSGLPAESWNRYLIGGNELFVFGRQSHNGAKSLSSRDKVSFYLSKVYNSPKDAIIKNNALKKELRNFIQDKDCVILRVPSILGLLGCQIVKEQKKPYLLEVVADAYDSYRNYGNILGLLFASVYHQWTKRIVKDSKYTLYVTKNYLQDRYPNKGIQLSCTNAVIDPVDESVLKKRINKIKSSEFNTIICGEIGDVSVKFKGCHIMLQAMKILKDEGINVEFHIVGGGNPLKMQKMAEKLGVADLFHYDGFLPHDKVSDFLDFIDIYVHPSFQEGLPRAVIEAISRGCPCATSSIAGTPELIEEKYLHYIGDVKKLAKDIKTLTANKKELIRVANVNFNKAKDYYSTRLDKQREFFYGNFFNHVTNEWESNF